MSCVYSTRWDKMKNFIQVIKTSIIDKCIDYALIKKFHENLNAWVENYIVKKEK